MRLLLKNTLKKIRKSLGRFLSIMFIIALGISVFLGLRESTAGMLYTADNYYDTYNLMDFKITSNYGLTNDDIKALEELKYAYKVIPSYSIDVLSNGDAIRVHAIEKNANNVTLIKGRMPKNNNECVADYYKYNIGDTISFDSSNITDVLSISKCKVVGTVKSVLYIRNDKGISSVGNGNLTSFVFINKSVFISPYYTEAYLIGKDTKDKKSYYADYTKQVKLLKNELTSLKPIRETIRYEEILKEANDKITKIKTDLDNQIASSTTTLEATKAKLDASSNELASTKSTKTNEFTSNYKKLNDSKATIISSLSAMGVSEDTLDTYLSDLNTNIANLKTQLSSLDQNSDEYSNISNQITTLQTSYDSLVKLRDSLTQINTGLKTLDTSYATFQSEIAKQEASLSEGYSKYNAGLTELAAAKEEANQKIADAKASLNDIAKPVWYLLDRTSNSGYTSYKDDVIKVDAIAKVLPIFFIIVVILMVSNTLTRLVEEERTEIGVLQSNGFSRANIIFCYLVYVFLAGLIGIVIGLSVGYILVPKIIYGVFLARYYVPNLITIVSPLPFSLVIITTLLIMTIVTVIACERELKEVPANLLRPRPPKSGKKVAFERATFIWKKLSFMWKATIRNLFRYKKRIIMTILGVAGCTALLIAGLGIRDSINTIAKIQYEQIIKYDSMYILDNKVKTIPDDLMTIFNNNGIVNPLLIDQSTYTFSFDNKVENAYLIVPSNTIFFNNYVTLKSTSNDKNISISDDGAIITAQMAKLLDAKTGDTISVRDSDNNLYMLYIKDITQNYVEHYIYMSSAYYKEIFNKDVAYNSIIADGKVAKNISLTEHNVLTVSYTSDILKTFNSFVSGLNKIIIMIVIFACFLALIVLYNLTIINVSERTREIATFKVLGFNDREIASFVYRETFILTIIGIICGLFLGIYFHRFIIDTSETDTIMFLRKINLLSYVLAGTITLIFSFIVQLIINHTLKKIDMIDSLKSVE